jgi:hypothetical protein
MDVGYNLNKTMNIRIKFIIYALLIVLISCKSENKKEGIEKHNLIAKGAMLDDFEIFQTIYEKANAGLYKYHTKKEIDSVFISNKKLITNDLHFREFYNILWNVIDYTGSCHNGLTYPETLDKNLSKQKIYFPIPLKYISNKLYTNLEYKEIPAGSELISVNNVPENQFSILISKYVSTDGFNKTGKYANIATDWLPFYIYLALGEQNHFKLKYKAKDSSITEELKIASVTYKDFYTNFKNRFSKEYDERKSKDYIYKYLDSIDTGFLEVNTFGMGGPASEGHKKYAKFLDSVFIDLRQNNIPNLIVDVRGNGGGNDPNDILLYSYLTQRDYRENTSAFTLFQDIPFSELYIDDDINELPIELKKEHSIFKNGRYYQNSSFNKDWIPNQNAFQDNLVLLVDPFVASAGSLFASLVKSDAYTTVIGEETLGGYYGHTGHIPVNYELPNSKLVLTLSIVDLEQDVEMLSDEKYGDGIIPDFRVTQTYQDFLDNKDTQLNFAIKKIKTLANKTYKK